MAECDVQQGLPFEIKIDKEGVWYYNGAEMFRKEILDIFFQHLMRDEDGRYYIEMGREICYLNVEDTPIVVKSVLDERETGDQDLIIRLSDSNYEKINLESLRIGDDNILYCDLCRGFPARFTRAAYYQIAEKIQCDEDNGYYIQANGRKYYIKENNGGE